MSVESPTGPLVLCYDGSEAAERAIRIAPVLVGRGRAARVFDAYKPTERSLGVAQALTGGSIDAPVHGESEGLDIVARGVAIARDAGFEAEPLLTVADRRTAEIIADTAEELDAPAIVMGQRRHVRAQERCPRQRLARRGQRVPPAGRARVRIRRRGGTEAPAAPPCAESRVGPSGS